MQYSNYSLREVEKQEQFSSVFVQNTGPMTESGRRERIIIVVPKDGMDGQDLVSIPDTDYPWDLTAQVSRVSLLRSSDLRRAIQKGYLRPINPEEAEKVLSSPSAKRDVQALLDAEEVNIMEDLNTPIDAHDALNRQQAAAPAGRRDAPQQGPNNGLNQSAVASSSVPGVRETLVAIMFGAENSTEGNIINAVRAIPDKTIAEYEYVLTQAKRVSFEDLAERVSRKLEALRAAETGDV